MIENVEISSKVEEKRLQPMKLALSHLTDKNFCNVDGDNIVICLLDMYVYIYLCMCVWRML